MTDLRAPRRASFVLLGGMVAALVIGPASAASASLGSVPTQVAAYVADGGMVARLADVFGKNAAGAGIDFDATTKAGPITRVYEWTTARLSSQKTDHPVQLTNNWVVPITIADKPVGLATLWINPQTVAPELADFTATPALATAMAAVPPTSALVRDTTTHAWLALEGDTVTPLVAGSSGLSKPTRVDTLRLSGATAPAVAPSGANAGLWLAIGAVGVIVVVIVIALLVPRRRRPAASVVRGADATGAAAAASVQPEPVVEPVVESVVEQAVEPVESAPEPVAVAPEPAPRVEKPAPASRTARPAAANSAKTAKTAKTGTPVTKPVGSKPGSRAPSSAAASGKPRVQKPPVQKPPQRKPPARKPPVDPDEV